MAAVLLVSPLLDFALESLYYHFLNQVIDGHRPWLFPFSLLVSGESGWSGWEMPPGVFKSRLWAIMGTLDIGLLAISLWLLANGFRPMERSRQQRPLAESPKGDQPSADE